MSRMNPSLISLLAMGGLMRSQPQRFEAVSLGDGPLSWPPAPPAQRVPTPEDLRRLDRAAAKRARRALKLSVVNQAKVGA